MADAVERALGILQERAHGPVTPGGPLAPLTSYRIGGPAAILFEPANDDDLAALAVARDASDLPMLIVGRGSNMLISDRGFDGIAVRLGAGFRWVRAEGTTVSAGAALPLPAAATAAMHEDLTGLEFAVAIPASVGGAVAMNAGAHGSEVADVLHEVHLYRLDASTTETVAAHDLAMHYRWTELPPDSIVTGASFALRHGTPADIVAKMDEAKVWRREHQPLNLPNGGSVFKNPPGDAAGRLVEQVCGRGVRLGGAQISEVHANFIVAERGARADEVYSLVQRIRRAVADETGITLEPELKMIGTFEEVDDGS